MSAIHPCRFGAQRAQACMYSASISWMSKSSQAMKRSVEIASMGG